MPAAVVVGVITVYNGRFVVGGIVVVAIAIAIVVVITAVVIVVIDGWSLLSAQRWSLLELW